VSDTPPTPDPQPELGRRAVPPPAPPREPPRHGGGLWWKLPLLGVVVLAAMVGGGVLWVQMTYLSDVPPIPPKEALWAVNRQPGMTFLDKDGELIAHRGPINGRRVTLPELPAYVPNAFLAAEDRRFYEHGPVDLRGIARAIRANFQAGRTVQGASTLTQQLARTLLLNNDQNLKRKAHEAVIAWRLEEMLGKDGVLELYLNRTFFGARAYGLDAAARTYFSKPASDLGLGEAALLAALPKAPSRLALTKDYDAAWARAAKILGTMREMGWITDADYRGAMAAPPPIKPREALSEGDLAWVLDMAAEEALQKAPDSPDLILKLTVDPALQKVAQAAVRETIAAQGRRRRASQAALVALAPDGAIRALVGGVDHDKSSFNRATQAQRQPGSAFKPLVYAAALEAGVTPRDTVTDGVVRVGAWSPENYGGGRYGSMTVARALALSVNTIAVKLAQQAGLDSVAALARRFGLTNIPQHPGASIALGAYEVSVLKLAGAYQVLQSGGSKTEPYLISEITDARGQVIFQRPVRGPTPTYHVYQASQMVRMMQGVIAPGGTGYRAALGRPAAAKTGTSQDWRDAWFVGFTPDWLCAVWVGNDNNRPMAKVVGGELPADIWKRFMLKAHQGVEPHDFAWMVPEIEPPAGYGEAETQDAGFTEDEGYVEDGDYNQEDFAPYDDTLPLPDVHRFDAPPPPPAPEEPAAPPRREPQRWQRRAELPPEPRPYWNDRPRREERYQPEPAPPLEEPYRTPYGPDEPQRRYRY
jgi:penicillin-binding protein 1A